MKNGVFFKCLSMLTRRCIRLWASYQLARVARSPVYQKQLQLETFDTKLSVYCWPREQGSWQLYFCDIVWVGRLFIRGFSKLYTIRVAEYLLFTTVFHNSLQQSPDLHGKQKSQNIVK